MRELLAELGFRTLDEAIGHADALDSTEAVNHWKAAGLDISPIFHVPELHEDNARRNTRPQDHGLDKALDKELIELCSDGAGERRAGARAGEGPQRQPHGRDDPRARGDQALPGARACPTAPST